MVAILNTNTEKLAKVGLAAKDELDFLSLLFMVKNIYVYIIPYF